MTTYKYKTPVQVEPRVQAAVNALMSNKEHAYTIGFLESQLKLAISLLPKTKQEVVLDEFENAVGAVVKVKVVNLLSGKEVEIPWDQVGGPCDPSTERYHTM